MPEDKCYGVLQAMEGVSSTNAHPSCSGKPSILISQPYERKKEDRYISQSWLITAFTKYVHQRFCTIISKNILLSQAISKAKDSHLEIEKFAWKIIIGIDKELKLKVGAFLDLLRFFTRGLKLRIIKKN